MMRVLSYWADCFVQAGGVDAAHGAFGAMGRVDDPGAVGLGQERAHSEGSAVTFLNFVGAEDLEGVFMVAMDDGSDGVQGNLRLHGYIS
jgi:hypothetical protein